MNKDRVSTALPRFLRLRDAPRYVGMDRNRFNAEVRPHLIEIPIGKQGVAFDRRELDAWADRYKAERGRHAIDKRASGDEHIRCSERPVQKGRMKKWGVTRVQVSTEETASGTSTKGSRDTVAFAQALALVTRRKQSATSDSD